MKVVSPASMKIVVLICAGAEWQAVKEILHPVQISSSALGEYFTGSLPLAPDPQPLIFFHGGWGKISAAASAQYAIDHFSPRLLINLGTCGGFAGRIERRTIILVERTVVYDIIEQMSDAAVALAHYETKLDLSWLTSNVYYPEISGRYGLVRGPMISADRDLLPGDIPILIEKHDALAADWESAAIAWVANKNGTRCLILRGVTDLVGSDGGEAYGNIELFHQRTPAVMQTLLGLLHELLKNNRPSILPET